MVKVLFIHKETKEKFVCVNPAKQLKLSQVFETHFGFKMPPCYVYVTV